VGKRRSLLAIPSTERLGAVFGLPPFCSRPNHTNGAMHCDIFAFGCIAAPPEPQAATKATPVGVCRNESKEPPCFTSGSVPELNAAGRQLCRLCMALRTLAGERPAVGRAATTRLTPWRPTVQALE
jgi:hypothetical protein